MPGFHLLEIIIVIFMVSFLASFGFPLYPDHFVHENRLAAGIALSKLAIQMEKYYVENNSYEKATLARVHFPEWIGNNSYQLIIKSASRHGYQLLAKPLKKQAEKDAFCSSLTLNASGEKGITGNGSIETCWH